MKLLTDVECIRRCRSFYLATALRVDEPLVNKIAIFGENCGRPIEFT